MAAATIDEVIARLIVLFEAIDGIQDAVDGWPDDAVGLNRLPLVVIVEDGATYTKALDNRAYDEARTYTAALLVKKSIKATRGTDSDGRALVRPWLRTIPDAFMGNLTLATDDDAGLAGIRLARVNRSTQPQKFDHAGDEYWGALFEFVVTTNIRL